MTSSSLFHSEPFYLGVLSGAFVVLVLLGVVLWRRAFVTAPNKKSFEHELEQARDEAQQAGRVKSDFLANMSHEIRTPMNTIIGFSHLALQTDLTGRQKAYVEKINHSAVNLLGVLDNVLDFSTIDSGKLTIEYIPFQLEEILNDLTNLVALKAEEKHQKFSVMVEPEVPNHLLGDPLRFSQILVNLGINAVKFTDEGGEISINFSVQQRSDSFVQLLVSVTDTGIGISQEQLGRLFQKFSQADNSSTRKHGGSGLGLVISQQLARLMSGDIRVESELGKGSTFYCTVRLNTQIQKSDYVRSSSQADDAGVEDLRGSRVLLVEDNILNQEIVIELLKDFDVEVTVADNGQQALKALEKQSYDGVLMDCSMPVMDGYEATREIRKQDRFRHLPVLAMTANTAEGDREKVMEAGMDDYIAKPVDIDQMVGIMLKWIKPSGQQGVAESGLNLKTGNETKASTDSPFVNANLPGIDVKTGLKRVRGDAALYRKLLEMFYNNQRYFGMKFHQAMDSADFEVMAQLAHAMKGVAGNIAASELSGLAYKLEQASHSRDTGISACLQNTINSLDVVISGIERVLLSERSDSQAENQADPVNAEQAEALMDELYGYIRKDNIRAVETLGKLESVLNKGIYSKLFTDMNRSLSNYDFEEALKTMDSLLKLRSREQKNNDNSS